MAQPSDLYRFELELSDIDRGVYEKLELRVARHPSESPPFLLTRVIAYALHFQEGIGFSHGLCEPDEPAIFVRDLTGTLTTWIEIGQPSGERLHRATRACPRVAVYTYKAGAMLLKHLEKERIHRREEIDVVAMPTAFLEDVARGLERRNRWTLVHQEDTLFLTTGSDTFEGQLEHLRLS